MLEIKSELVKKGFPPVKSQHIQWSLAFAHDLTISPDVCCLLNFMSQAQHKETTLCLWSFFCLLCVCLCVRGTMDWRKVSDVSLKPGSPSKGKLVLYHWSTGKESFLEDPCAEGRANSKAQVTQRQAVFT